MYIESVPNRSSPPAVLLRESYRAGGHVKKRTLANLSKLPTAAIETLRRVLRGERLVNPEDAFTCVRSLPHGHIAAVLGTLKRLGLHTLIARNAGRLRDLVLALIVARVIDAQSKLATARGLAPRAPSPPWARRLGSATSISTNCMRRWTGWWSGRRPSSNAWPSSTCRNTPWCSGVDPIPWTPILLARRRSPQCRSRDRRTRRHSDSRWSSWFGPDVHRESWLGSSSRRPRRYETGSRRLVATPESGPTA